MSTSQNVVPRLRFPKGADAIYIVDEYGRALPMKKSSKNPCIYYFHEKYFEPGYVSRRTARSFRNSSSLGSSKPIIYLSPNPGLYHSYSNSYCNWDIVSPMLFLLRNAI